MIHKHLYLADNFKVFTRELGDLPDISELGPVYPGLGTALGFKPAPHLGDSGLLPLKFPSHCPVPEQN